MIKLKDLANSKSIDISHVYDLRILEKYLNNLIRDANKYKDKLPFTMIYYIEMIGEIYGLNNGDYKNV